LKAGIEPWKLLWTEDEDARLRYSVQIHNGKNWAAIAALVPGRTKKQCSSRWNDGLDPSSKSDQQAAGTQEFWTRDEDVKLRNAVQMHDGVRGKDWVAIAPLLQGRTRKQCRNRWHHSLKHIIDRGIERNDSVGIDGIPS
jgi:hypothetical protein